MYLTLALLVFLPVRMWIEMPSFLPQMTAHRILILIAFFYLIQSRGSSQEGTPTPLMRLVLLLGLSQFVSLLFGSYFVSGLKVFMTYVIETALFYAMISEYARREIDQIKLLSSICYGLGAVAVIGFIEKYGQTNLAQRLFPTAIPIDMGWEGGIISTYPHRILLGYAMAMGVPLALALPTQIKEAGPRRLMFCLTLVLAVATYFSMSRGPWLGLGLGLVGMAVLGGRLVRKRLMYLVLLAAMLVIVRPGVRETIYGLYLQTVGEDSAKAVSYHDRFVLWNIAFTETSKSPIRFLFGLGPYTSQVDDFSNYWGTQEGAQASIRQIGHTSWDNTYACDLLETGYVGLGLEAILYLSIIRLLLKNWRDSDPDDRALIGGITVSCLIFLFAMSNVNIFAPQLKYLFWSLVALGVNYTRIVAGQRSLATVDGLKEESETATQEAALTHDGMGMQARAASQ
jgi:O-antigen ligase